MAEPTIDDVLRDEDPAFAKAIKAVLTADVDALRAALREDPNHVGSRARAAHGSSLLHYVACNGIEDALQLSSESIYRRIQERASSERPVLRERAIETAKILVDAGSEVDATCGTYGGGPAQTPLNLLVSSGHPHEAGVMADLVRVLCRAGASPGGIDNDGSPLGTALAFSHPAAARTLVQCGAKTDNIVYAAALGAMTQLGEYFDGNGQLLDDVGECDLDWFRVSSDPKTAAEQALVFASLCGEVDAVRYLLDRGVDINAQPDGSHVTATALHSASVIGHENVVSLLLDRGADTSIQDRRYSATPLGWAEHCDQPQIVEILKRNS